MISFVNADAVSGLSIVLSELYSGKYAKTFVAPVPAPLPVPVTLNPKVPLTPERLKVVYCPGPPCTTLLIVPLESALMVAVLVLEPVSMKPHEKVPEVHESVESPGSNNEQPKSVVGHPEALRGVEADQLDAEVVKPRPSRTRFLKNGCPS